MRNYRFIISLFLLGSVHQANAQDEDFEIEASSTPAATPEPKLEERDLLSTNRDKSPCEGAIGGCLIPASDASQTGRKDSEAAPAVDVSRVDESERSISK